MRVRRVAKGSVERYSRPEWTRKGRFRPARAGSGAWPRVGGGARRPTRCLTLVYLRPLWRVGGDRLPFSQGDPLFNLYVLKWSAHQIRLGLPDLWNANLFYPTRGTLALSDHLLGPAAQLVLSCGSCPTRSPATTSSSSPRSWRARWPSAGSAPRRASPGRRRCWRAGCTPSRRSALAQTPHLQILIAQWAPLTLWFWDRLLAERTTRNAALFLVFYLLNLTGGCYLAYMIHFPLLALLANRAVERGRELLSPRSLRRLLPVGLIAGAAVLALFLPYLRVSQSLGLVRTHEEIREFGATPASYLQPRRGRDLYFGTTAGHLLHAALGAPRPRPSPGPRTRCSPASCPPLSSSWAPSARLAPAPAGSATDLWERGLALSGLVCFAPLLPLPIYAPLMRIVPGMRACACPPASTLSSPSPWSTSPPAEWTLLRERLARTAGPRGARRGSRGWRSTVELAPRPLRWEALAARGGVPRRLPLDRAGAGGARPDRAAHP